MPIDPPTGMCSKEKTCCVLSGQELHPAICGGTAKPTRAPVTGVTQGSEAAEASVASGASGASEAATSVAATSVATTLVATTSG